MTSIVTILGKSSCKRRRRNPLPLVVYDAEKRRTDYTTLLRWRSFLFHHVWHSSYYMHFYSSLHFTHIRLYSNSLRVKGVFFLLSLSPFLLSLHRCLFPVFRNLYILGKTKNQLYRLFKKRWIVSKKSVQCFSIYTGHLFQFPLILISASVQRFSVSVQSFWNWNRKGENALKRLSWKISSKAVYWLKGWGVDSS